MPSALSASRSASFKRYATAQGRQLVDLHRLRAPRPPDGRDDLRTSRLRRCTSGSSRSTCITSTRCGLSAKLLERESACHYQTAWRMLNLHPQRSLMADDGGRSRGDVEVDEASVDGKPRKQQGQHRADRASVPTAHSEAAKLRERSRATVFAAVERGGGSRQRSCHHVTGRNSSGRSSRGSSPSRSSSPTSGPPTTAWSGTSSPIVGSITRAGYYVAWQHAHEHD